MIIRSIQADKVSKKFGARKIFSEISFRVKQGDSLSIAGKNGSGKSTLCKVILGLLSPSLGVVKYDLGNGSVDPADARSAVGFVSPYFSLYEDLTGMENMVYLSRIRSGEDPPRVLLDELFERFQIAQFKHVPVRTYSSGMKQRLKYIFALAGAPSLLILDEPTSNLDESGSNIVRTACKEFQKDGILIIASNEAEEVQWCSATITLNSR